MAYWDLYWIADFRQTKMVHGKHTISARSLFEYMYEATVEHEEWKVAEPQKHNPHPQRSIVKERGFGLHTELANASCVCVIYIKLLPSNQLTIPTHRKRVQGGKVSFFDLPLLLILFLAVCYYIMHLNRGATNALTEEIYKRSTHTHTHQW